MYVCGILQDSVGDKKTFSNCKQFLVKRKDRGALKMEIQPCRHHRNELAVWAYVKRHSVDSFVFGDRALGELPPQDVRSLLASFLHPFRCTIDDTVNTN